MPVTCSGRPRPSSFSVAYPSSGWSSQRHWHSHEDEFVWVVEGELTLVANSGEELLRAGNCAAFKRGVEDGHHLINKSARPARVLEIGNSDAQDRCVHRRLRAQAHREADRLLDLGRTLGIITRMVLTLKEKSLSVNTILAAVENGEKLAPLLKLMDQRLGGTLSAFEAMWGTTIVPSPRQAGIPHR
jgi:hypothetical protein